MKRIYLRTNDPSLKNDLSKVLPRGFAMSHTSRIPARGIVFIDIDSLPLGTLEKFVGPHIVVAITARRDTERIMETMAHGVYEILHRPLDAGAVGRVLGEITVLVDELRHRIELPTGHPAPTCAIVGDSPGIIDVCKELARLSQVDVPVLITGETGTGKELIAESIAQYSNRFGKPFVVINCASVPETLLESELFGFERGAFTGAVAAKAGLLRIADEGTVFLDEVGELPLVLQAKLLRFLQTQAFFPIGSSREVQVNVRVVSASNRDIREMVRKGTFREDLYHRLCVATLRVPPLRERETDILPLVRFFVERYRHTAPRPVKGITTAFLDALLSYHWPGNIRELENVVRSAMAVARTHYFTTFELQELRKRPAPERDAFPEDLEAAVIAYVRQRIGSGERGIYRQVHDEVDRAVLEHVLAHTRENQSEAARILGINRLTLRKRLGYGTGQT